MASLPCDYCGRYSGAFGSWDAPIKIMCKKCSDKKESESNCLTQKQTFEKINSKVLK